MFHKQEYDTRQNYGIRISGMVTKENYSLAFLSGTSDEPGKTEDEGASTRN